MLENPAATKFRAHVMDGDWVKADHYLHELLPMVDGRQAVNIVVSCHSEQVDCAMGACRFVDGAYCADEIVLDVDVD